MMGKPIYYMTALVTIIRNKQPYTRSVWIVSSYENPIDIMRHDQKTMTRLRKDLFTDKAKDKSIVINKIQSKVEVGTTSRHEETQ